MRPASPGSGLLWRSAGVLLSLACVAWVGAGVVAEAGQLRISEMALRPLASAAGLLILAYVGRAAIWTALLRRTGQEVAWGTGARVFLGSQLGRYAPGKVWQLGGAAWLGTRAGLAAERCVLATGLVIVLHNLVGAILGLGVLYRVAMPGDLPAAAVVGALGLAALGGLLVLLPGPRARLRHLAARLGARVHGTRMPPTRDLLLAAGGLLGVWLLLGGALQLVSMGCLPGRAGLDLGEAVPLMAASAVVGFLVLFAPSGLGVREAVMVAALLDSHTRGEAGVIALASRVLMTAVELGLAAWALSFPARGAASARART